MTGYLYDTGALVAAERGERGIWAIHRRLLEQGLRPTVPATVLAQAWRGVPQPQLSRFLTGCDVRELTEEHARSVGRVLGRTGGADIVDGSVVVMAQRAGHEVITSDPDDLGPIAAELGRPLVTIRTLDELRRP